MDSRHFYLLSFQYLPSDMYSYFYSLVRTVMSAVCRLIIVYLCTYLNVRRSIMTHSRPRRTPRRRHRFKAPASPEVSNTKHSQPILDAVGKYCGAQCRKQESGQITHCSSSFVGMAYLCTTKMMMKTMMQKEQIATVSFLLDN